MDTVFFFIYCISTTSKRFVCLKNKCLKHFIPFLLNRSLKRINIWIGHHHHHIVLAARISLTLSRHSSLSFIALGRSSGQQPVSSHSC